MKIKKKGVTKERVSQTHVIKESQCTQQNDQQVKTGKQLNRVQTRRVTESKKNRGGGTTGQSVNTPEARDER